jgi:hypothetical protein
MPEVTIQKEKFDALLKKMLDTPPLPKSEVKATRKKKKKPAA